MKNSTWSYTGSTRAPPEGSQHRLHLETVDVGRFQAEGLSYTPLPPPRWQRLSRPAGGIQESFRRDANIAAPVGGCSLGNLLRGRTTDPPTTASPAHGSSQRGSPYGLTGCPGESSNLSKRTFAAEPLCRPRGHACSAPPAVSVSAPPTLATLSSATPLRHCWETEMLVEIMLK